MPLAVTLLSLLIASAAPATTAAAPLPSSLEPTPSAQPAAPAAEPEAKGWELKFKDFSLKPLGFVRLKYSYVWPDPNVAFVGHNSGFSLQNARAGVVAKYGTLVSATFSIEGAVDEREGPNDVVGTLRIGIKDAFADVTPFAFVNLRGGRFAPTFELEGTTPENTRVFVDRSLEYRGVAATEGYQVSGLAPLRSLGVALRADDAVALGPIHLGYELLVANAAGEFASTNESSVPAVSASIFPWMPGWGRLVAGVRWEERRTGDLPFQQTEKRLSAAAGLEVTVFMVRVAGQVLFRQTSFPTTGGPAENGLGAHAEASVRVLDTVVWLDLAYRYAWLHPSDLIGSDIVQEHTAGVALGMRDWPLRFQLNYTYPAEEAGRELTNDRVDAALQVSL